MCGTKGSNTKFTDCLTRALCSYLSNRTARVRIGECLEPAFSLYSGVPQGGCLSPTLFNLYTRDINNPIRQTDYISYADDITQIIPCRTKTRARYSALTTRNIQTVNEFEHKLKISTNRDKFTLINIGRKTNAVVRMQDRDIQHTSVGKVLGLTRTSIGYTRHYKQRQNIARAQVGLLYRFRNLNIANKRKLYLYPTTPTHTASKTQLSDL